MRVAIGSDHAGVALKEALKVVLARDGHQVADFGCAPGERADYPVVAHAVAEAVAAGDHERAVLVCGSGVGVSMAANRVPGVRAALASEPLTARLSREHNDANVLCLGARLIGETMAQELLGVFLSTPFEGGRHEARVRMLDTPPTKEPAC